MMGFMIESVVEYFKKINEVIKVDILVVVKILFES